MANASEHYHTKLVKKGLERLERQSGSGTRGTPKKEGGGGKYVWGTAGQEYEDPLVKVLDEGDPNYVDEPEKEQKTASKPEVSAKVTVSEEEKGTA